MITTLSFALRLRRACLMLGAFLVLAAGSVRAATYYVSTTGDDASGAGTLANPWRTIQKAASIAVPGDTVSIRGGIYRETVVPANSGTSTSPIVYQPYNNERVTINGADVVTGSWSVYSGSIYQVSGLNWDLGAGRNQVFLDDQMVFEARYPNTGLDVSRPIMNHVVSGGETGTGATLKGILNDSTLGAGLYVGARLVWGGLQGANEGVVTESGVITDSTAGQIMFTYDFPGYKSAPSANQPYYIYGKLGLLDAGGEWFFDNASHTLYLQTYSGSAPPSGSVQMKRRPYGFDLSGLSHITLSGLKFFATTIVTDPSSSYCVFDKLELKYVDHFSSLDGTVNPYIQGVLTSGVQLWGTGHDFTNSVVAFSAGNGVLLQGADDYMNNCLVRDVDYFGGDCAGISTGTMDAGGTFPVAYRHVITNNTVYNSGRALILYRALRGGIIVGNDCYNPLLQRTDGAALYVWNQSGADGATWTEVAYNKIHEIPVRTSFVAVGIYHDSSTSGPYVKDYAIHHNLVYNGQYGFWSNDPSEDHKVYNNTFATWATGIGRSGSSPITNFEIKNNLSTKPIASFGSQATNLANVSASNFVDAAAGNYQLAPGSVAIDAGTVLAPYTDGYVGSAPDIGAFEYGTTRWLAGSNLALTEGFEIDFLRWSASFGTPTVSTSVKRSGGKAYEINQDQDMISFASGARLNRVVSIWFYDDATRTTAAQQIGAFVDDNATPIFLGVTGSVSASNYVYGIGGTTTASSVVRSSGWHRLEWDYRSGTDVKLYIDGQLVATTTANWSFNSIRIGDMWANGTVGSSGYFDDIGISDKLALTIPFTDSFEAGFGAFTVGAGTPTTSTAQAKTGTQSYILNQDRNYLQLMFDNSLNANAGIWFYDNGSSNAQMAAFATDGTNNGWLGVSTPVSTGSYCYRTATSFVATSVARTVGWHHFEFDATSGSDLKLIIDGTQVAALTTLTSINSIGMGDFWTDGRTSNCYFDDINVDNVPAVIITGIPFSDSFEAGFGAFTVGAGTPTASTAQAKTGTQSYILNQDREYISKAFGTSANATAEIWFYDNGSGNAVAAAYASNGANTGWLGVSTTVSAGSYCYRSATSFVATSVARTVGWHLFEFDATSGSDLKLKIDGIQVAVLTALTSFNSIGMGDFWTDGRTSNCYFDTVDVY